QPAQILVSRPIFDEHVEDGAGIESELGSYERANAGVHGGAEKTRRAVDAVAIPEGKRSMTEARRLVAEVLGERCAVEEAERAPTAELDVIGFGLPTSSFGGTGVFCRSLKAEARSQLFSRKRHRRTKLRSRAHDRCGRCLRRRA